MKTQKDFIKMDKLEEITKSKPNVRDYDYQPYSYIHALQTYADKLEKLLSNGS